MNYKDLYKLDIYRYGGHCSRDMILFHKILRMSQGHDNKLLRLLGRLGLKYYRDKFGIEIMYYTKIGAGLVLSHPYNITVNGAAVIGKNVSLYKGCTIGEENRGKRKGAPVLGDCVWVGTNAQVVGNIVIGNDVLIAPNSFVNCDVPSHSVVYGNPCVIKSRNDATKDYINNKI